MILIIDDDAAVRSSLSLLLKRAGHEFHCVVSPEAALAFVRHTTPDVMLMDMNFSLTTKGDEGLDLLQKMQVFLSRYSRYTYHGVGLHSIGCERDAAGSVRFYDETMEQPPTAEIGRNRARFGMQEIGA